MRFRGLSHCMSVSCSSVLSVCSTVPLVNRRRPDHACWISGAITESLLFIARANERTVSSESQAENKKCELSGGVSTLPLFKNGTCFRKRSIELLLVVMNDVNGSVPSTAITINGSIDGSVGFMVAFERSSGIEADDTWSFGTCTSCPTLAGSVASPTQAPQTRRRKRRDIGEAGRIVTNLRQTNRERESHKKCGNGVIYHNFGDFFAPEV